VKGLDPEQRAPDEQYYVFVDGRPTILFEEGYRLIPIAAIFDKSIIAIISQQDAQVGHSHKQHHSVQNILKLEVLHDALVATSIHGLVELLEDEHPLEVHDDNKKVGAAVELHYVLACLFGLCKL